MKAIQPRAVPGDQRPEQHVDVARLVKRKSRRTGPAPRRSSRKASPAKWRLHSRSISARSAERRGFGGASQPGSRRTHAGWQPHLERRQGGSGKALTPGSRRARPSIPAAGAHQPDHHLAHRLRQIVRSEVDRLRQREPSCQGAASASSAVATAAPTPTCVAALARTERSSPEERASQPPVQATGPQCGAPTRRSGRGCEDR